MKTIKTFTTQLHGWQTEYSITINQSEVAVFKDELQINWGFFSADDAEEWFLQEYLPVQDDGTELVFINDEYVGNN